MVCRMPENEEDPGANTQMFQAFVAKGQAEAAETSTPNRTPLLVGGIAVAVVVLALIVWLLVR
jgi:hypothetical protein